MYSLMNVATSWAQYFTNRGINNEVLSKAFDILSIALWVVLGLVGAAGAIYAIYLGIRLARAEEQSKRDDAKKHLITVCIAIGVTIALIIFFNTLLPMIIDAFSGSIGGTQTNP